MSFIVVILSILRPSFALDESLPDLSLSSKYQPIESAACYGRALHKMHTLTSKDDRFVRKMIQRQKKRFVSRYDHPSFAVPHRIATIGNALMFGGSVTVLVGGALVIVGIPLGLVLWDPSLILGGLIVMATGSAVFTGGLVISTVGTLVATGVLRKKGLNVPVYGLLLSAAGLLVNLSMNSFVRATGEEFIPIEPAQYTSLISALSIPAGLVAQTMVNRRAFNQYVDTLSVAPVLNKDAAGLVLQGTF